MLFIPLLLLLTSLCSAQSTDQQFAEVVITYSSKATDDQFAQLDSAVGDTTVSCFGATVFPCSGSTPGQNGQDAVLYEVGALLHDFDTFQKCVNDGIKAAGLSSELASLYTIKITGNVDEVKACAALVDNPLGSDVAPLASGATSAGGSSTSSGESSSETATSTSSESAATTTSSESATTTTNSESTGTNTSFKTSATSASATQHSTTSHAPQPTTTSASANSGSISHVEISLFFITFFVGLHHALY